jgi:hypothetical protein
LFSGAHKNILMKSKQSATRVRARVEMSENPVSSVVWRIRRESTFLRCGMGACPCRMRNRAPNGGGSAPFHVALRDRKPAKSR